MSDNLSKLAHKIDFAAAIEDTADSKEDKKKDAESLDDKDDTPTSFQPPQWPWDSVRNKLR